jgi:type IX secretion system substrate protein
MFMKKYLLLVLLSTNYFIGSAQTSSQTRTATYLNNLNQFRQVFGDQNYPKAQAKDLAADDNVYGCSSKLAAISDSSKPFTSNSVSSLALQGFGFTIPDNAAIENIAVRIRRFKNGRPPVGDYFLSVMQRYQQVPDTPSTYGRMWTNRDTYPGIIYPDVETEYTFLQSGSGNDGGFFHNEPYQWTPAMVNNVKFGVRIDNFPPIGHGSVQICYDLVEITIEYSQIQTIAGRSPATSDTKPMKEPIVFPNPFTAKANIQFTAAENGKAVVELFSINGAKTLTLFSKNVVQGQMYNVGVSDAQLSKGMFIYRISNGKQQYTGRIIKLE